MNKKRTIATYSRRNSSRKIYYNKFSIDDEFDVEIREWKKKTVTNLYKKLLEKCSDSFEMGNQQDHERLLSAGKEESEWQTIGFVSKSNCDSSEPDVLIKPGATPMPKAFSSKTRIASHNKRWSHNRKVNNNENAGNKVLTKSTRTLRFIQESGVSEQNKGENSSGKFNSTVCDGGVSLSLTENQIHGLSPINRTSLRRRVTPLRPATLKKLATPIDSSRAKVEKWLASTGKKDGDECEDEEFDSIVAPLAKAKFLPRDTEKQGDRECTDAVSSVVQKPEGKPGVGKYNRRVECLRNLNQIKSLDTSADDFSPIPSNYDYFENENTLESCIAVELNAETTGRSNRKKSKTTTTKNTTTVNNQNNNGSSGNRQTKKRRKRKRICMRTAPNKRQGRKTYSPNLRKPKKSKSRVEGKELKVPKTSPAKFNVDIKDGGELTFQKKLPQRYKLRNRTKRNNDEETDIRSSHEFEQKSIQRKTRSRVKVILEKISKTTISYVSPSNSQRLIMEEEEQDSSPSHENDDKSVEVPTKLIAVTSDIKNKKEISSTKCNDDTPPNEKNAYPAVTTNIGKRVLFSTKTSHNEQYSELNNNNINNNTTTSNLDNVENITRSDGEAESTESCCLTSSPDHKRPTPTIQKIDINTFKNLVQYESSSVSSDCLDDTI